MPRPHTMIDLNPASQTFLESQLGHVVSPVVSEEKESTRSEVVGQSANNILQSGKPIPT